MRLGLAIGAYLVAMVALWWWMFGMPATDDLAGWALALPVAQAPAAWALVTAPAGGWRHRRALALVVPASVAIGGAAWLATMRFAPPGLEGLHWLLGATLTAAIAALLTIALGLGHLVRGRGPTALLAAVALAGVVALLVAASLGRPADLTTRIAIWIVAALPLAWVAPLALLHRWRRGR